MNVKLFPLLGVIGLLAFSAGAESTSPKKVYRPEDALQLLDQARTPPQWEQAKSALKSLTPGSGDVLKGYFNDTKRDGQKRFLALDALCQDISVPEKGREFRSAFLRDTDPFFRAAIARGMGNVGDEDSRQLLKKSLADKAENGLVQVSAAVGLARMNDHSGKERALKAIMEAEPWSDVGVLALEILEAKEIIPILVNQARSSKDERIQYQTRKAILRLKIVGRAESEQVEILNEALLGEKSSELKQWAGKRLGEIGGKDAQKVLVEAMEDPKGQGQDAARRGLMIGVEKGHWKREDVQTWLAK